MSVYIGPGDYKKNVINVFDDLELKLKARRFVAGGDLNAAHHLDDVYGGQWYKRFLKSLADRGFHDCHWAIQSKEVQSFWGPQAREAYQDDHIFIDVANSSIVVDCMVIDNPLVRRFSDHGPLQMITSEL